MTSAQLNLALQAGADAAERAKAANAALFIGGEMGIANTTAATAMYCALLDVAILDATGAGTGLDREGMIHKSAGCPAWLARAGGRFHQHCRRADC